MVAEISIRPIRSEKSEAAVVVMPLFFQIFAAAAGDFLHSRTQISTSLNAVALSGREKSEASKGTTFSRAVKIAELARL
jgi:hypothetical protein